MRIPGDMHAALLRKREETGKSLNDLLIEGVALLLGMSVKIQKGIPGRKPGQGNKGEKREKKPGS